MDYLIGCLVCGGEITYSEVAAGLSCHYCGVTADTNAYCVNGHYVCDSCHNASANDLIERVCSRTDSVSPLSIALTLLKSPAVKMHGPDIIFSSPRSCWWPTVTVSTAQRGTGSGRFGRRGSGRRT